MVRKWKSHNETALSDNIKVQLIFCALHYIGYKSWEVWYKMCCVWSGNNFEFMCGTQNASHYHPDISNYSRREHEGRRLESH